MFLGTWPAGTRHYPANDKLPSYLMFPEVTSGLIQDDLRDVPFPRR